MRKETEKELGHSIAVGCEAIAYACIAGTDGILTANERE